MSNPNKPGTQSAARSAVANATGGDSMTVTRDDVGELSLPKGAEAMLTRDMTKADLNAFLNDSESEFAPQILSLEPGMKIEGILEGYGKPTEFTTKDQQTGNEVTRTVNTFIIKALHGNMRVSILSSVQLDAKLPPFIGDRVSIARGPDVKSRSNAAFRIADYVVKGPPVNGKERSKMWASQAQPRIAIDVPALPPGSNSEAMEGGEDTAA